MKNDFALTFIGLSEKESTKEKGKFFHHAKFNDEENDEIFSFYMPEDKLSMLEGIKKYSPVIATLAISTYNGQIQVNLAGIQAVKK
jgi:hypothetical protein